VIYDKERAPLWRRPMLVINGDKLSLGFPHPGGFSVWTLNPVLRREDGAIYGPYAVIVGNYGQNIARLQLADGFGSCGGVEDCHVIGRHLKIPDVSICTHVRVIATTARSECGDGNQSY